MDSDKRTARVGIVLSGDEVRAIDEWRWHQIGMHSRGEAIRRLIAAGIAEAQWHTNTPRVVEDGITPDIAVC